MIKKCVLMLIALGACAATPLTPEETLGGVARKITAQTCYQRGWVSNPPVVAAYLSATQSVLANRGNPTEIAQVERQLSSVPVTIEDCRSLELEALQYAQQQAEQARQREAFSASMDSISQNAAQMQSSYQPRTTTCQHYQWGNMTTCNSF
ncbi:hypothetical protein [Limimaricola cinnabarinus]|uniref:hypothetical protein n=1 Tax=Limimaricola cinnabarinus TaxID=1125964 RepID=UPI002FE321A4